MTDRHKGTNRQGQTNGLPDLVATDNAMCQEDVLVELKPKALMYWAAVFMILTALLFFIFGVIIPVLKTGSYASVWPSTDKRIAVKTAMFYIGWIVILSMPRAITVFNQGHITFYYDRLEILMYINNRKRIFYYKDSLVDCLGGRRVIIYSRNFQSLKNPLKRYKIKYIESALFSLSPKMYKDSSGVNHAVELLREKAFAFNEKNDFI